MVEVNTLYDMTPHCGTKSPSNLTNRMKCMQQLGMCETRGGMGWVDDIQVKLDTEMHRIIFVWPMSTSLTKQVI
jgi:hypothetical protein